MTRIILTVGCVGKTYADRCYINVYDFDKHTLDYKYDRVGFEHLSNEEFKSLPGRTIKDGWFESYMNDWCEVIDSGEYEVVTGWLQEDCLNYLLDRGYDIEIVLVDIGDYEDVYKERSQKRGNNEQYWENLKNYYGKTLEQYRGRGDIKVVVFDKPYYLSEYLTFSGVILKKTNRLVDSYVHAAYEKVDMSFRKEGSVLSPSFVPFYTQLVLTALSADMNVTEEMVHDAWSIAMIQKDPMHSHLSMIPFGYLTCEVQYLDTPYVEKLNEVLDYFKGLKRLVEVSDVKK